MSVNRKHPEQTSMILEGNIKIRRELGIEPRAKYPHAPGHQLTDTSHAAAKKMTGVAGKLAKRVLSELKLNGPMTADQMAEHLKESPFSIRPRFTQLKELGLIEDTGVRAKNAQGNAMAVCRAKEI